MKNYFLSIFLIASSLSFSQISSVTTESEMKENSIEIGAIKPAGIFVLSFNMLTDSQPPYFFFTYKDYTYTVLDEYKSFGFKDIDGTVDILYNEILKGFRGEDKIISFNLGEGKMTLLFAKAIGAKSVQFVFTDENNIESKTMYFTPRQISKMFDRKYDKKLFK